ncbi:MAG: hypothetical protein LBG48_00595 [Rickettsiales bacterium]|jgi:hypothetical protein|nr:hypothetical protein [Rickettsiales bacterium]
MNSKLFPERPKSKPMIYAYEDTNPELAGLLKVGYTTVDVENALLISIRLNDQMA